MVDTGALQNQFRQHLGREATPEELAHMGKFIDQGEMDVSEIGQFLQSTPEYQQNRLNTDTNALDTRLQASDSAILGRAGDVATAKYAELGRPQTSALGASVMSAAGSLAQNRQSALASFYSNGLQRNAALGAQQGTDALNRGYQNRTDTRNRQWSIEDYYRQKNDAADYEKAHSGWNAITPEFAVNAALNIGGKVAGGVAAGAMMSDFRAKKNIERVGHIGPLNVYAFDYRDDIGLDLPSGRQVGFMAQEVERFHPEAIGSLGGFKTVNYAYLAGVL